MGTMKKLIFGIILLVFVVLAMIGSAEKERKESTETLLGVLLITGGILTYLGYKEKKKYKQTIEYALQMLRDENSINSAELAIRVNISEIDIRGFLMEGKRKGLIPFKAEIT